MKTTNTPINDKELENNLTHEMTATSQKSDLSAGEMAAKQLPALHETSVVFYWNEFFMDYQGCIDHIALKLQIPALEYKLQGLDEFYNERKEQVKSEIHRKEIRQIDIQKELRTVAKHVMNWGLLFMMFMAISACVGDTLYNRQAFEYFFGVGLNESWVIAGIAGLFIWGLTHFVLPRWLKQEVKSKIKILRYGIILAISFIIFYGLGVMRSDYTIMTYAEEGIVVNPNPFFFALTSWALFLGALAFTIIAKRYDSKHNAPSENRVNELKKELRHNKKQMKKLKKELRQLDEEMLEERARIIKIINYGNNLEQRVITEAKRVFHNYKKTNFLYRKDGKPACFDDDTFPFTFSTYCLPPGQIQSTAPHAAPIVAIAAMGLLYACNTSVSPSPHDKTVVVLSDPTDVHLLVPDSNTLWPFLNIKEHPWSSCRVEVGSISNIAYAPTKTVILKAENNSHVSMNIRKEKIKKFKRDLFPLLYEYRCRDSTEELDQSVIYRTLVYHLKRLQDSNDAIRQLLVYSNLMEHSDIGNFYKEKTLLRIRNNPDEFAQELEAIEPIGDLTGIEIYLLFQPRDFQESQRYVTVSNFYKRLFGQKGATVHIGSLTNF